MDGKLSLYVYKGVPSNTVPCKLLLSFWLSRGANKYSITDVPGAYESQRGAAESGGAVKHGNGGDYWPAKTG